jgi:DNA-binding transcriptional LysR family regulator
MNNGLDLRRLRYFVAVAEERHFSRAAERLGLAQPPLTQQIQKLEREIGYPLFLRQHRRITLTDAGSVLLDEAVRILRDCDAAVEHARQAGRGETGRITLGTPPSVMLTRLPAVIRRYRERHPRVRFTLRELSTGAIAEGLIAQALDVGLLREVQSVGELETEVLLTEPVVAVLPRKHALADKSHLRLKHLAGQPFVLFPRRLGEAFFDRLMSFCARAGFTPQIVQEATQWQSVIAVVETGLGVSLGPACVERFAWPGVVYRRLPGLSTSVSVCAATQERSAAVAAFLGLLKTEFRA